MGNSVKFSKKDLRSCESVQRISKGSKDKFMRTAKMCGVEHQMSTTLNFKHYGNHVMSRKFKSHVIFIYQKFQWRLNLRAAIKGSHNETIQPQQKAVGCKSINGLSSSQRLNTAAGSTPTK